MKCSLLVLAFLFFGVTGFSQTTIIVNFKDLDKDIQKYIHKNYDGYTVYQAKQQMDNKGNVLYSDVYVSKGTEKYELTFDKKDNFVKKDIVMEAAKAEPAKVDATK